MRAIIIIVIVAVLGFFGYEYGVNNRTPMQAIDVLTGKAAAEAAAAEAAAEQAAIEEAEAAAAQAAAAELEEAAAAQAAAEAEAAATAAQAEAEAVAAAEAEATLEEAPADFAAQADTLLTVDGFDVDKVVALLDGANIPDAQKTILTNALNAAKDNPALLQPVLDNIRNLLGL